MYCRRTGLLIMVSIAALAFVGHAATYTLTVDASSSSPTWNRFYEESVGSCHPMTVLNSGYGRNIQNALRRGHTECGFKKFRAHSILNDAAVYSENNGTPVYNWTTLDRIYDTVKALGMTAIVELSGMPTALASGTQTAFWYNGVPMNITPPKDYNKWRDLIRALVQHMEQRYGADEIRRNWSFEVWNEPNLSSFFTGTITDYLRIYDYASEGVRLADSLCKVGGPATSGGDPGWIDQFSAHVVSGTNYATGRVGSKCDFVSYHRYADDSPYNGAPSTYSCPRGMNLYHQGMVALMKKNNFRGELQCTEWAPTWRTLALHSDNESSGSFIAKTIHLLADNDLSQNPLPTVYSFWCISDIFEEWNAGTTTAFDSSYGMMLRGDRNIPDSWDVPKACYNTYRLLHKVTDKRLPLTGGTTGDGVNGFATLGTDNKSLQVIVYNHVDGGAANSTQSDSVVLNVNNIPFLPGDVRVEYWLMDRTHSNAYRLWQSLGSPKIPSAVQWAQIKTAADLVCAETPGTVTFTQKTFTKKFRANIYSVGLINLISVPATAVRQPKKDAAPVVPSVSRGQNCFFVYLPNSQSSILRVLDLRGKQVLQLNNPTRNCFRIDYGLVGNGIFIVADDRGVLPRINPMVVAR
jgi:xylan 1,4-beta-xylosidase